MRYHDHNGKPGNADWYAIIRPAMPAWLPAPTLRYGLLQDDGHTLVFAYRAQRGIERRVQQSHLPREKTLRTFQLERLNPALRLQIERLKTGTFVDEATNVIAVGPPGVGKEPSDGRARS